MEHLHTGPQPRIAAYLSDEAMTFPALNLGQVGVRPPVHNHLIQYFVNISGTGIIIAGSDNLAMEPHSERYMNTLQACLAVINVLETGTCLKSIWTSLVLHDDAKPLLYSQTCTRQRMTL